jgi:hypothetical protein
MAAWAVFLMAVAGMAAAQGTPSSPQSAAAAPANAGPSATAQSAHPAPVAAANSAAAAVAPVPALTLRQQQLLAGADQLMGLAQQLKAEVDKSNRYTLSLTTLRRAADIEKTAKGLQKQVEHGQR